MTERQGKTIPCSYCTKPHYRVLSTIGPKNFCSAQCWGKHKSATVPTVECDTCKKPFQRYVHQIKDKNYCSHECFEGSRKDNMLTVPCDYCFAPLERYPSLIHETNFCGYDCMGNYKSGKPAPRTGTTKISTCIDCNKRIAVSYYSAYQGRCDECKDTHLTEMRKTISDCQICGAETIGGWYEKRQYCDICYAKVAVKAMSDALHANGPRSKNEIMFAELCIEQFNSVETNVRIFEDDKHDRIWDADVIIHDLKVAVSWNGVFHYKQIFKDNSLQNVQRRDRWKTAAIKANGYKHYVIKDMGVANPKFVHEQFAIFMGFVSNLPIKKTGKKKRKSKRS